MVIGIWFGESKPLINEYLERFVTELKEIIENGIIINTCHIKIRLGLVICDTPARSLLKGSIKFFSNQIIVYILAQNTQIYSIYTYLTIVIHYKYII